MNYQEMRQAIQSAKTTLNVADAAAEDLARMLVGRLRAASKYHTGAIAVAKLKRELRDFNLHTMTWREK